MDKEKKKKLTLAMKEINEKFGEGTIYSLDSKHANKQIPRWSTGIEDFDKITGGGLPAGRIIELYGPESAGKTTLAYHLMSQLEAVLDIPIEGTFDNERAKVFGNKKGQLFVSRADYGEEALLQGYKFTKAGGDLVVIDSVPSLITRKELEQTDFEKDRKVGMIASMLTAKLPKIVHMAEETGTTWIFVNQVRDNIGGMMFGPTTHTPGGRALKHYCSLRIQVNRLKWIKIPNKNNESNSAKELVVGLIMKVKVMKSKVCNPLGECELPLFFDRGFVAYDQINPIRKELMKRKDEIEIVHKVLGEGEDDGSKKEEKD